ncbi:MAG: hypothetical protein OXG25_04975 [Gammaproteobacteria bacterium]|nr:hypothetical protein [Gammaproteobacteria bacterium]
MAAVVLGSVLIYSLFLPQAAPKQITLAVLPFPENGEFTPLSVGFSSALRDSIALSRDVAVVDTVSTNSVMWNPDRAPGMSHVLAITHFVDGELHSAEGKLERIDFRVVNVSHPNWQEVLNVVDVEFDESKTLQSRRDDITLQVRSALYDNSSLRTEPVQYGAAEYREYLATLGEWLLRYKDSSLLSSLHEAYYATKKDLFQTTNIATQSSRELWNAVALFEETQDAIAFSETVWNLAGEYPNSLAVDTLGSLAFDVQKLRLAEHTWLRVARLQPQSAFVALNVAHVRRLLGDSEGTDQAFRIAELRDDLDIVRYFRVLDGYLANDVLHYIVEGFDQTVFDKLREASGGMLRGEFLISASIHIGSLSSHRPSEIESAKLWRSPPLWLRDDDPRWTESRDFLAQHIPSASAEIPTKLLSKAESTDGMAQLFAPRRPE